MFQHFGQRLKRDLKQLVDRRLDASVVASGSVLKVSVISPVARIKFEASSAVFRRGSRCHLSQTSAVRTSLFAISKVVLRFLIHRYAVWFGGSLLASLVGF